jgi:hypothetical protein
VHRDQLAHGARGLRAGLGGRLDRAHVTGHDHGDQPVADLLPPDDRHVGGFDHRVGGSQRRHVALRLDHPERVLCH